MAKGLLEPVGCAPIGNDVWLDVAQGLLEPGCATGVCSCTGCCCCC